MIVMKVYDERTERMFASTRCRYKCAADLLSVPVLFACAESRLLCNLKAEACEYREPGSQ